MIERKLTILLMMNAGLSYLHHVDVGMIQLGHDLCQSVVSPNLTSRGCPLQCAQLLFGPDAVGHVLDEPSGFGELSLAVRQLRVEDKRTALQPRERSVFKRKISCITHTAATRSKMNKREQLTKVQEPL